MLVFYYLEGLFLKTKIKWVGGKLRSLHNNQNPFMF